MIRAPMIIGPEATMFILGATTAPNATPMSKPTNVHKTTTEKAVL